LVFPVNTAPVADFYAIEESKDRSPCRLCQRQRGRFLAMAEIWGKGAAKWVGCNHDAASVIHHLPEFFGALNPRDILIQAADQNVSQVRTYFHATQEQKIILCSLLVRPATVTSSVELVDTQAVEPLALGITNEF